MSLEAFVGVLFASFVGAITFAKVARAQSFAQVMFSELLVVRYGSGTVEENESELFTTINGDENHHHHHLIKRGSRRSIGIQRERSHRSLNGRVVGISTFGVDQEDEDESKDSYPCPILEFQLVNRLHDVPAGQIMDATTNMVASIDLNQFYRLDREKTSNTKRTKKKKKNGGGRVKMEFKRGMLTQQESPCGLVVDFGDDEIPCSEDVLSTTQTSQLTESYEEDVTGHLVPRRIFARLEVETQHHPFLQHTWIVRHILNEHSPLLIPNVRETIQSCGGLWPMYLTNLQSIRSAIAFDQILVSFSGTSNADGNTVYAQKVYGYDALIVGHRFANMLYRSKRGARSLRANVSLINKVIEQAGGGGEELDQHRKHREERNESNTATIVFDL